MGCLGRWHAFLVNAIGLLSTPLPELCLRVHGGSQARVVGIHLAVVSVIHDFFDWFWGSEQAFSKIRRCSVVHMYMREVVGRSVENGLESRILSQTQLGQFVI